MSRATEPHPARPAVLVAISPDERSAEIVIEGHRQFVTGRVPKETRRAALDVVTRYAARLARPVLVDARDANGAWRLVATPEGVVRAAGPADEVLSEAAPAPRPGGKGRRAALAVGAGALVLVVLLGGAFAAARLLPGPTVASSQDPGGPEREGAEGGVPLEGRPPPPGFGEQADFRLEMAPGTRPAVDRDGALLTYIDPQEQLVLLDSDQERRWAADLPMEAGSLVGVPRFVDYGDETSVLLETPGTLWFWPVSSGRAEAVDVPEDAQVTYAGHSVLVSADALIQIPLAGELVDVDRPAGASPVLADGDRVLMVADRQSWIWVEAGDDGAVTGLELERPAAAAEVDRALTARQDFLVVQWSVEGTDDVLLALHDSGSGAELASVPADPGQLADSVSRSSTQVAAYGPVLVDLVTGAATVREGFAPSDAAGELIFGEQDGESVVVRADGTSVDTSPDAARPWGLLDGRAIVVSGDHLYALSPE